MKGYTTRDVAHLLGLSPDQVRSYARAGFLTPARGPQGEYRFRFQDLVLLRTAKALVDARIPARRIRRVLEKLQRQLPHGRSLSEVRILAEGDRIIVRDGETAWSPESGQVHLDLAVSDLASKVAPLARRVAQAAHDSDEDLDADHWYDLGLDLEAVDPEEALAAYERALEIDPEHADAHVNLGRLLHEAGESREAEAHYRLALASEPKHATAAFNLGIVLEDLGRPTQAIKAYLQAIAADAELADAYFNLARMYERRGDRTAALRYLKSYKAIVESVS